MEQEKSAVNPSPFVNRPSSIIAADGRPEPKLQLPIESFCVQAAILVQAEKHYDRLRRVHCAMRQHPELAPHERIRPPQTFNDFLDQMIVRGVVQISPILVELERSVGLAETLADDDVRLLRKVLADDLTRTADALAALGADRGLGRSALGAMRDTAALLHLAAEENLE